MHVEELNSNHTTGCVVVVDDEPDIKDLICTLVSCEHPNVEGFTDPEEALKFTLKGHRTCGLLTDFNMPRMNGDELIDALQAYIPFEAIAVVTAAASDQRLDRLKHQGIRVIEKPEITIPVLEFAQSIRQSCMRLLPPEYLHST